MAKIAIRHNNIVPYGEIFYAMNEFKRTGLDKLVDGRLNVRCTNYGYQYSDIMLALFSIYLCGGDHIEDITTILNKYLSTAPGARIPSSDTIARGLKELRALSIAYTSKTGSVYVHDPAIKLNPLLLDMALLPGILKRGQSIDVDFDNEFIPAEKSDALYSYKKKRGYFPGIDMKSRLKRFVFAFIVVPAKWIRVARQWTLNRKTDGCTTGPFSTLATDKLKVLEGLQCNIPDGVRGHYTHMSARTWQKVCLNKEKHISDDLGCNELRLLIGLRN